MDTMGSGPCGCEVCGEVTVKTRLHYGGITCYSCRAFFRRACTKKKKDICKRNNNCDVRGGERKRCGACRYIVCIERGMKPHLVLTDEEKQQRFKNAAKRKAEGQGEPGFGGGDLASPPFWGPGFMSASPGLPYPPQHPRQGMVEEVKVEVGSDEESSPPRHDHPQMYRDHPLYLNFCSPPNFPPPYSPSPTTPSYSSPSPSFSSPHPSLYPPTLPSPYATFPPSLTPPSSAPGPPLSPPPPASPSTHTPAVMSGVHRTSVIMLNVRKKQKVEEVFEGNSTQVKSEEKKSNSVQDEVNENEPLKKSMKTVDVMNEDCARFQMESPFEQSVEVQEGKEEEAGDEMALDLSTLSMKYPPSDNYATKRYILDSVDLYKSSAHLNVAPDTWSEDPLPEQNSAANEETTPPIELNNSQTDCNNKVTEYKISVRNQNESVTESKAQDNKDCEMWMVEKARQWSPGAPVEEEEEEEEAPSPEEMLETVMMINIEEIENMYTREEENYVTRLCDRGREKWMQVNFGGKLFKAYVDFCRFGTTLSKEFFQSANRQLQERYIRMALCTEEFPLISSRDQLALLKSNLGLTELLTYIRSINFKTAEEEITSVFGETDMMLWRKVRTKLTVKRTSDIVGLMPMDEKDLARFGALVRQCMIPIITDHQVFSLLVPLLLLSTNTSSCLENRRGVEAPRSSYLTLLERYLRENTQDAPARMKEVMGMVSSIKEMAQLFHKAKMSPGFE